MAITAPADFNASASGYLKNIWISNGTATGSGAGTLTGPDANGFYTVTLTGVTIPDTAAMLTGGLGFSYNVTSTLPLTQTNVDDECGLAFNPLQPRPNRCYEVLPSPIGQANEVGGLIVIAPTVQKVADGYTGRRPIVEDARCNKCHQELGAFTEDSFHGGQRNDGTTCAWCHTPNRTSSGWSADSVYFVHAIHGGAKRTQAFTWHASAVGESFADVKFPGVLKNCEGCHIRGSYDFSAPASESALPNRLYRTVATGVFAVTAGDDDHDVQSAAAAALPVRRRRRLTSARTRCHRTSQRTGRRTTALGFSYNAGLTTVQFVQDRPGHSCANPAGGTLEAESTDSGQFADRRGVHGVPRHFAGKSPHRDERWFDLCTTHHRASHGGDLHDLPCDGSHRGHQGHAREVAHCARACHGADRVRELVAGRRVIRRPAIPDAGAQVRGRQAATSSGTSCAD